MTRPDKNKRLRLSEIPEWLRAHFTDTQRYLILWILAGVLCGFTAVLFHLSIDALFAAVWTFASRLEGAGAAAAMIAMPAAAGLFAGIYIHRFAPSSGGSGIPQTKVRYYHNFGRFHWREAAHRYIVGTVSVGMGLSLGREGPTVHICAALASKLGQIFGLARKRVQAMVPVGMGAGIAAAFNAPIAAMFFVFEELLGDFSTKSLFGILVSVVIAAAVERVCLGEHPAFTLDLPGFETDWWMLACIPLGAAAGLAGHAFVKGILRTRAFFKEWQTAPPWLKPALGGLGVGLTGAPVFYLTGKNGVFGIGYGDLSAALNGSLLVLGVVLALLLGKFIATMLAYGSGNSGGIFAPALFIGGMLGAAGGIVLRRLFGFGPELVAASALLGMGAFFAAVIRCPLTSFMIVFEMTREYALILPLMIGNATAYLIASKLQHVPIYDALLLQDKISLKKFPGYKGQQDWRNLPVSVITSFNPVTAAGHLSARENMRRLEGRPHHAYPVVDARGRITGVVTRNELEEAARELPGMPVSGLVRGRKIVSVFPGDSIRDAANTLVLNDILQAPVVNAHDPGQLLGIVTLHDIARQQNAIEDSLGR